MNLLLWIVFCFLLLRVLVAGMNLASRPWLKRAHLLQQPLVSVLIPARNEEKNLQVLLKALLQQDYRQLEILVYDDLSDDNTWDMILHFSRRHPHIRGIRGKSLPQGWTGKNHACHQLACHSKGEYLLFLDADVIPQPELTESALAYMQKHSLQMLSLFPSQIMVTMGEKLAVPLMNWILLSLLPLHFTRWVKHHWLAAANGQFMLFRADIYKKHWFHRMFSTQKTEDIIIARFMKKNRLRIQTMLGGRLIGCRMYQGWKASLQGFSKNVLEFFGGSLWLGPLFAVITTLGLIPVGIILGFKGILLYLALALGLRLMVAAASRQPIAWNLVLWPLQHATFLAMIYFALRNQLLKSNTWKGRQI